jgi:arylsulfatase A-like enzyme
MVPAIIRRINRDLRSGPSNCWNYFKGILICDSITRRTMKQKLKLFLKSAVALCAASVAGLNAADRSPADAKVGQSKRPNVLLIVADDLGYSDLGCFGGEIKTPNLDALAKRGLRGTNFCVGPTCSPTRSMLLSGCDNHVAGLGNMEEFLGPKQKGKPGYEGHLNDRVVSVASLLRDAGYHTYMAGKWHLGLEPEDWPAKKGFERDFSLLQGGGSNWSDMLYPNPAHPHLTFTHNGKLVEKLSDDYFSSQAYSDFIMQCVDEQKDDGKPFFAYLSFQAVHSPFAAPDDWLDKFKGQYDAGYDAVRAQRLTRMKEMGIVGKDVTPFPRLPGVPAWEKLTPEQQKLSARRMEVYAAMLSNMDYHIGRVLNHLKSIGELDNTVVIFFSDNGAESVELQQLVEKAMSPEAVKWMKTTFDLRPEAWGRPRGLCDYGSAWAQVGAVPFAFFKAWTTEGGIRSPLIVAGPGVKHNGDMTSALLHVMDIAPTLLELAGAEPPSKKEGSKFAPIEGKSMLPLLAGTAQTIRTDNDWIGWELFGNRAIRQGDWKLTYLLKGAGGNNDWKLHNLKDDPAELHDLSEENPDKRKELLAHWNEYVKQNGVLLTNDGMFKKGKEEETIDDTIGD